MLLGLGTGCPSRASGDDDDGGNIDGEDAGGDPCPESLCCPGKTCPGGFMCTPENTCVSDPCGGAACCDDRPCDGEGLDCVAGQCVPRGTLGEPCSFDSDCNGPEAQCLLDGWPEGYCIQACVEGDCPGDGICFGASCFDGCLVLGDCRLDYECVDVPGGKSCRPI